MSRSLLALLAVAAALLPPAPAAAHKPSDSYLRVLVGPATGDPGVALALRWDLALRDLEFLVGLDADGNSEITWGEVDAKRDAIAAAALSKLELEADGRPVSLALDDLLVDEHSDGVYAVLRLRGDAEEPPGEVRVTYRLLFDADPTHRGLVFLDTGGEPGLPEILGPERDSVTLDAAGGTRSTLASLGHYVREGVRHIWLGLDHFLFLITLLLPAVLTRREGRWEAAASLRAAAGRVLRIVTAFTIAHSVTLWLATSGLVSPPLRLVEASIAASIVVCAVHNLLPRVPVTGTAIAFAFGLLHGFGFAAVLADAGLNGGSLGVALLGFNVGVELGQLAIVAVFFPVAWQLRGGAFYRWGILRGGSVAVAALAGIWLLERAAGLEILGL